MIHVELTEQEARAALNTIEFMEGILKRSRVYLDDGNDVHDLQLAKLKLAVALERQEAVAR